MPKRLLVNFAVLDAVAIGIDNSHATVLVQSAGTASSTLAVIVGVAVRNRSLDDERTLVKTIVVTEDFKFVVSNAVFRVRLVEYISKVSADESVFGAVNPPA